MLNQQAQRLLAEALGTFTLVAGISLAALQNGVGDAAVVTIAFGCGLALLAGLYAFSDVSGGHFNPAVSLGMFLSRRLSARDLVGYSIAQIVGAIVASLSMLAVYSSNAVASTTNAVQPGFSSWDALWLEFLVTGIFVAVILESSRSERSKGTALIAIPFTLVMAHIGLIRVDGTSLNPARSLGPAIVDTEFTDLWIFIVAPLAGGVLAAIVHALLFPPYKEEPEAA